VQPFVSISFLELRFGFTKYYTLWGIYCFHFTCRCGGAIFRYRPPKVSVGIFLYEEIVQYEDSGRLASRYS